MLGDAGAQAMAESLKVNTALRELELADDDLGLAGAMAVAEALMFNNTLVSLAFCSVDLVRPLPSLSL